LDPGDGLRLGVLAFRDHEDEYITKDFGGFTADVDKVVANLGSLEAEGGDDYPEAVAAALDHASKMNWRSEAVKIAVLITDAPPHGIGEKDDDYWEGDPNGRVPLLTGFH
jgi:Mg-chelatase subunit ChlD